MSLLLETIRFNNGIPENLDYHDARVSLSQIALDGTRRLDSLESILEDNPPPTKGLLKCRLIYNKDLFRIEYSNYTRLKISKLKIWKTNSLYYPFKFANREIFESIKEKMPAKTEALIVVGDRITDTTFTNSAFLRKNKWYTPANPLLKGTRRAQLIDTGIIKEEDIFIDKLLSFEAVRLFNAMIPWDETVDIPITQISNE